MLDISGMGGKSSIISAGKLTSVSLIAFSTSNLTRSFSSLDHEFMKFCCFLIYLAKPTFSSSSLMAILWSGSILTSKIG
jgi:hypothetical protein